jgi:hypothetical protein
MRTGTQADDLWPKIDQAIIVIVRDMIQCDMDGHSFAPGKMTNGLKARPEPDCKSLFYNDSDFSMHPAMA